jgi:hypothetical protein
MRGLTSFLVVIGALALPSTQAGAVDITECLQVVPPRQVGNLVGDLDCTDPNSMIPRPGFHRFAVELERGATLNLNGFSLVGPTLSDSPSEPESSGVFCRYKCRVNGPGTITGFGFGIQGRHRRITVTDVTINGATGGGLSALQLMARRCTITGNTGGVSGGHSQRKFRIYDSEISGNDVVGVSGRKILLKNVIVTGNGKNGVFSDDGKVLALDSVIIGNGVDCASPPPPACRDLSGTSKKRLIRTLFGTCSRCSSRN